MTGELKPTVKSALMFEAMSGKNFFSNLSVEDELLYMYCVYCSNNDKISYEAFISLMQDKKFVRGIESHWKHYGRFMEQFKEKTENNEAFDDEVGEISMESVASALIFKYGLDPDYVLNKAELWELNFLLKAGSGNYQEQMETQRLWTFLTISPHMDPKKSKNMTPSKMFPFPWEDKTLNGKKRKRILEEESERAKNTIGMTIEL